jgi:hypothetical protein
VLVVRVDGLTATVTYTDIHNARLRFFKSLFEGFDVAWEGGGRRGRKLSSGEYLLATGVHTARDDRGLDGFLAHLGSRIVFLIDWNRMRKRLRAFVSKRRAIGALKWAAANDYGNRGLIEIDGEQALAEAVEYAAGKQLRYGQRLDELISDERATGFLREAMRLASVGLQQRRSRRVIQDEIKAKLRRFFEYERLGIFDTAAAHVALGHDIAFLLRESLERGVGPRGQAWLSSFVSRATLGEATADRLLNEAREDIKLPHGSSASCVSSAARALPFTLPAERPPSALKSSRKAKPYRWTDTRELSTAET